MNKKLVSVFGGLVLLSLLVSACGKATPTATVPAPEATPAPTTAPATPDAATPVSAPVAVEPAVCEVYPLTVPVRPVDETDYIKGENSETASVTIYEYADFQCPACSSMAPVMAQFLKDHPEVRLVYRHFPLSFHDKAQLTAEAAEAAGAQGKFWEMHDLLYTRVAEWNGLSMDAARAKMTVYAEELGLDVARFDTEMDSGAHRAKVNLHMMEAQELQLPGTPSYIFDGLIYPAEQFGISYQGLEAFLPIAADLLKLQARQYTQLPPQVADATKRYEITVTTSQGDIVFELDAASAPTQANSFLFLAQEGWYNDAEFFFVMDDFAAVTGDPSNTGNGSPGYYCIGENVGTFDVVGQVGLVPNGQFFFSLGAEAARLNGAYPVIGRVIRGLEVLDKLYRPGSGEPTQTLDRVIKVSVAQK